MRSFIGITGAWDFVDIGVRAGLACPFFLFAAEYTLGFICSTFCVE